MSDPLAGRDYLTIQDVADRLGISYRRALEIVRDQIPHYRPMPRDTRIPKREFARWLARRSKLIRPMG